MIDFVAFYYNPLFLLRFYWYLVEIHFTRCFKMYADLINHTVWVTFCGNPVWRAAAKWQNRRPPTISPKLLTNDHPAVSSSGTDRNSAVLRRWPRQGKWNRVSTARSAKQISRVAVSSPGTDRRAIVSQQLRGNGRRTLFWRLSHLVWPGFQKVAGYPAEHTS